ncbi:MAG: hypothetical protein ACXW0J_02795 [Nitrososphaeraceae archaeon]
MIVTVEFNTYHHSKVFTLSISTPDTSPETIIPLLNKCLEPIALESNSLFPIRVQHILSIKEQE